MSNSQDAPATALKDLTPFEAEEWEATFSDGRSLALTGSEMAAIMELKDERLKGLQERIAEASQPARTARDRDIVALARRQSGVEGELEIDCATEVSEADGNGAYVNSWVWVEFSGTPLDKESEEEVADRARSESIERPRVS